MLSTHPLLPMAIQPPYTFPRITTPESLPTPLTATALPVSAYCPLIFVVSLLSLGSAMAARTSQAHREITPPYARLQKLQQNLETAPSSSQASPSKWSRGVVRLADPPSGLAIHTVDDDEELDNPSPGGGDNDAEWDIESLPEHQARTQNTPRENIHPGLLIPLIQRYVRVCHTTECTAAL